jgi:hypothetical protein
MKQKARRAIFTGIPSIILQNREHFTATAAVTSDPTEIS